MSKYQVKFFYDGNPEIDEEIFDTEEQAIEYADYGVSCCRLGAWEDYMSNPGDYGEYDESDGDLEYEIIEVEE